MNHASPHSDIAAAYQTWYQHLLNHLIQRVSDQAIAEDILQDVFVKALKEQEKGTNIKNLKTWLFTVTKNALTDYYRQKKINTSEDDLDWQIVEENDHCTFLEELHCCLQSMIQSLPEKYRDTLMETEFKDKTLQQVANEMDVTVSAVKSRVSRARKKLKEEILDCCDVNVKEDLVTKRPV